MKPGVVTLVKVRPYERESKYLVSYNLRAEKEIMILLIAKLKGWPEANRSARKRIQRLAADSLGGERELKRGHGRKR
jgi:hypothetical protein